MIYTGTSVAEFININDNGRTYFIEMAKMFDEPIFMVCSDYDENWFYEFYMENNSDYERVKFNIMSAIFECENMDGVIKTLNEVFEDGFSDILVKYECDCDGSCEHCNCNK